MNYLFWLTNLIQDKFQEAIAKTDKIETHHEYYGKITLNQNYSEIIYQTPYCLLIASKYHLNSLFLAEEIANHFNHLNNNQSLQLRTSGNGWLEFVVGACLLEKYLNYLHHSDIFTFTKLNNNTPIKNIPFAQYYLYLRSSSLLKSAHTQQIIQLNNLDFLTNQWQIVNPLKIDYHLFAHYHQLEQSVIKQLLLIVEKIKTEKLHPDKALTTLEKLFALVESQCRIWGATWRQNPQISQSRLGLIALILHFYQNIFFWHYRYSLMVNHNINCFDK